MTLERRIRVVPDTDPMNPREWDCIGRMICFHRRYNLGDSHRYDADDCKEQLACEADDDLADCLDHVRNDVYNTLHDCAASDGGYAYRSCHEYAEEKVRKTCAALIDRAFDAGYVALPLYLYDHSGITMNTGGFGCPWDSGCVGLIVCDKETVDREFNGDRDKAADALRAEVKAYDDYISGNVYVLYAEERVNDGEWYGEWDCVDSVGGIEGGADFNECAVDYFGEDYRGVDIING
jgi:hypothetical protein